MNRYEFIYQATAAFLGALTDYLYGGWPPMIRILIAFVIIDYVTGMIAATYTGTLSSKVGFRDIAKKMMLFFGGRSCTSLRSSSWGWPGFYVSSDLFLSCKWAALFIRKRRPYRFADTRSNQKYGLNLKRERWSEMTEIRGIDVIMVWSTLKRWRQLDTVLW